MSLPRVVHGLAKKRAQLAAELIYHDTHAERCRKDIATLDAALALWEQSKDVPIRKHRYTPKPALVPHLVRRITDAMRTAREPLTTRQIVDRVSADLALSKQQHLALTRMIGWRLRDMRKDGRVCAKARVSRKVIWVLADWV